MQQNNRFRNKPYAMKAQFQNDQFQITTNATKLPMQKKHIMLQTPKKQCLKKAKI